MEEKKNKISLSVFISILAVLVIIIMAGFIYMQKINSDREIAGLKNDSEELKATVTELQGKLDSISNIASTSEEENKNTKADSNNSKQEYDVEISISELENLDYSNETELKNFYNKYDGKKVKITAYVRQIDDNVIARDTDIAETAVDLVSNPNSNNDIAIGTTSEINVRNILKTLKIGQKISISGVIDKESQPVTIYDFKIVE